MSEEPQEPLFITAFGVVQDLDGNISIIPSSDNVVHPPTPSDLMMIGHYMYEFFKQEALRVPDAPKNAIQQRLAERLAEREEASDE